MALYWPKIIRELTTNKYEKHQNDAFFSLSLSGIFVFYLKFLSPVTAFPPIIDSRQVYPKSVAIFFLHFY